MSTATREGFDVGRATELLHAVAGPDASFRQGQLEAIRALVQERERVLVVQRTGWGKSAVYFIATRMSRDHGAGPTLLISPLLALMRNQIVMAERAQVLASTINSSNRAEHEAVIDALSRDNVDYLPVPLARAAADVAATFGLMEDW